MRPVHRQVMPAWLARSARTEPAALPPDWWGPVWNRGARRTLSELIAAAVLDTGTAAVMWRLVEQGESVTIAAPCGSAGKTTLLTALLDAIPPHRPRRFVRGIHDVVSPDARSDVPVALLVNEISPHLPIYCWGPALRSALERVARGDQLLATIHAATPSDVIDTLAAAPLRLPRELITGLGWVAVLGNDRRAGVLVDLREMP